jgi:hypothetical protein
MDEQGGGGLELAWILWTCVAALFLIFGVAELVSPPYAVSFWLVSGLACTGCSVASWVVSRRGGGARYTLHPTMRWTVRIAVGALVAVAVYFAASFSIPRHDKLPGITLGQPDLYRVEVGLAVVYGGLLLLMALFHGVFRGELPSEISREGAKWGQAASAANVTLDELDASVKTLQRDSTDFRAKLLEKELAAGAGGG